MCGTPARCVAPLAALFEMLKGQCDGISIADATAIVVCDNRRIARHRVFADSARRGKTSMGWFYGFKLHAIINSRGELIRLRLTADKGYLAQWLTETLDRQDLQLITPLKKNMQPIYQV